MTQQKEDSPNRLKEWQTARGISAWEMDDIQSYPQCYPRSGLHLQRECDVCCTSIQKVFVLPRKEKQKKWCLCVQEHWDVCLTFFNFCLDRMELTIKNILKRSIQKIRYLGAFKEYFLFHVLIIFNNLQR